MARHASSITAVTTSWGMHAGIALYRAAGLHVAISTRRKTPPQLQTTRGTGVACKGAANRDAAGHAAVLGAKHRWVCALPGGQSRRRRRRVPANPIRVMERMRKKNLKEKMKVFGWRNDETEREKRMK